MNRVTLIICTAAIIAVGCESEGHVPESEATQTVYEPMIVENTPAESSSETYEWFPDAFVEEYSTYHSQFICVLEPSSSDSPVESGARLVVEHPANYMPYYLLYFGSFEGDEINGGRADVQNYLLRPDYESGEHDMQAEALLTDDKWITPDVVLSFAGRYLTNDSLDDEVYYLTNSYSEINQLIGTLWDGAIDDPDREPIGHATCYRTDGNIPMLCSYEVWPEEDCD